MSKDSSARTPIAKWNLARGVWETAQTAICGHSVPYSGTWPTSGMTRDGVAYPLPLSELRTEGFECSSSPTQETETDDLLPTPTASDVFGAGRSPGRQGVDNLRTKLLPTPTVSDIKGANHSGGQSASTRGMATVAELLPTPTSRDFKDGPPNPNVPTNGLLGREVWDLAPNDPGPPPKPKSTQEQVSVPPSAPQENPWVKAMREKLSP